MGKKVGLVAFSLAGIFSVACSGAVLQIDDAGVDAASDASLPYFDASTPDARLTKDASTQDADSTDATAPDAAQNDGGIVVLLDSGVKDGGGVKPDGGTKPDGGPLSCYDEATAAEYVWDGPALAHQNQCSNAQLTSLYNACFGPAATQASCDAFSAVAANLNCLRCVQGYGPGDRAQDVKNLPQPAVLPVTRDGTDYLVMNTRGCAAAVLGLPNCGNAVTDIVACTWGSCESCVDESASEACIATAEAGVCQPLIAANQAACLTPIDAGKATWDAACIGPKPLFEDAFQVLAATMCGP